MIPVVFLQATQAIALTPISGWESLTLPLSSLPSERPETTKGLPVKRVLGESKAAQQSQARALFSRRRPD